MNAFQKIDDIFTDDKIVYHYTKTQTAFEHILHTNCLKLSIRKTSIDPIENIQDPIITHFISNNNHLIEEDKNQITQFIKQNLKNTRQICFCKNDTNIKLDNYIQIPYEYYGFMKPRMWDQYGDKYNGICLAFDLDKLIENNPKLEHGNLRYVNYNNFNHKSFNIKHSRAKEIGVEKYCEEILSNLRENYFLKHIDYSGENEYRFVSLSENFMTIKDSLKAIIVSQRNLSTFANEHLKNFAEKNNIKYFTIDWVDSGVIITSLEDFKAYGEIYKQMKK